MNTFFSPRFGAAPAALLLAVLLSTAGAEPAPAADLVIERAASVRPLRPIFAYEAETFAAGLALCVTGLLVAVYVMRLNAWLRASLAARDKEIGRRKRTEDALRRSKERYRSMTDDVLDTSAVGLFILDSEFEVVWVNRALERYFGVNREQIIGRDKRQLIRDRIKFRFEDPDRFARKVLAAYKDNTYVETFECHVLPGEGREERWLEHWSQPIRRGPHAGGRIEHYYDITDRKQAEETLRRAEARYRTLVESLPAVTYTAAVDQASTTLYVSPQIEDVLGVTPEEYDQDPEIWRKLLHPDDRDRILEAVGRAQETGRALDEEYRMVRPDGRTVWMRDVAHVMRDADGERDFLLGVMYDITERRRASRELKRSRDQYQSLVANIPGITYRCKRDHDWTMLYMSSQVDPLTGYPASDFIHNAVRTYESVIHRDDTEYVNRAVNEAADAGEPWEIEYRVVHRDGGMRWVYEKGRAVAGDDGETQFLDGFILDVTKRKRAEKRLRHFEKAVESSADAIGMATPDGRHYYQNEAFTELFGMSVEQANGEAGPPSTVYADEEVGREVFDTIMRGDSWVGEVEMRGKGGQTIYVSLRAYPLKDEGGRIIGLVGLHTDITERRRSQEVLARYAAELERSNRDLQDFTYAVSHDLQEPLRKIHTFGEFLFEDCIDALPEKGREHVRRMQDATVRMKDLIQHLLRLSRVDSRGAEPEPTESAEVVGRVADTLSESITDCHATLDVEPDLPWVLADATQLEQVFQNLVGNALKFRAPDRRPVVRIGAEREDGEIVFSVSDNGIGIEEDYQDKIFAVFQRLHRREEYDGTGVGLALCKKIVSRHGGRIWVESRPGEGSTFRFSLRAAHRVPGQKEGVTA